MPIRLSKALILTGLLIVVPSQTIAQRYGARSHGGGGHGGGHGYQRGPGGGYQRGFGGGYQSGYGGGYGYGGYQPYYGYGGYGGYGGYYGYGGHYGYHHDHDNGAWIAIGAGILGVLLGSAISHHQAYHYGYPYQAPPPPPPPAAPGPVTPRCQDGSPIPAGGYCQGPPPPVQQPMPERG